MKKMVRYPCNGYCVSSSQSIDKQLFSKFPADPNYVFSNRSQHKSAKLCTLCSLVFSVPQWLKNPKDFILILNYSTTFALIY
jgi:hypothetical protein